MPEVKRKTRSSPSADSAAPSTPSRRRTAASVAIRASRLSPSRPFASFHNDCACCWTDDTIASSAAVAGGAITRVVAGEVIALPFAVAWKTTAR